MPSRHSVLFFLLMTLSISSTGNAAVMGIYDAQFPICTIADSPGPKTVLVVQKFSYGTKAVRFKIVAEPGMTMTYTSETHPYVHSVGNTQEGLAVCLDECEIGDIVLATITYMGHGTSSHCAAIRAVAHPDAETLDWVDCGGDPQKMDVFPIWVRVGTNFCPLCIDHRVPVPAPPGTPQSFGCEPLPTQHSTWGNIKALYSN